jgi:uncharacterized protein YjbI with pentapeptide repeats
MSTEPLLLLLDLAQRRRTARALVLRSADLRGGQLARLHGDGLDLSEGDLRGASFAAARWRGCVLRHARLEEADFSDATLRMCDFDGVGAGKAVFARARLENSTARGARFDGADLRGAILTDTDFSRASFRGADLEGVAASGVNLRGADLQGARLGRADLTDADLRGADLTGADLEGAVLHGADLRGAIGAPPDPAAALDEDAAPALPPEWQPLADTMTPIVLEVLRSSGRRGAIDPEAAARALRSLQAGARPTPRLPLQTINAVSRVLGSLGDDVLPALIQAMGQPEGEPPPEVQELIRRLGEELEVHEAGTSEEILARMTGEAAEPKR